MSHNLQQYLELRAEASKHFRQRNTIEASVALNVAQQHWKLLAATEQDEALASLANREQP